MEMKKKFKKKKKRKKLLCNIAALFFIIQIITAIIERNRRWQQRTTEDKFGTRVYWSACARSWQIPNNTMPLTESHKMGGLLIILILKYETY